MLLTTMTPLESESDYARLHHHHHYSFALGDSDMASPQRSIDALSERSLITNTSSSSSGLTRRQRGRRLARHNGSGSSNNNGGLRTNHQIPETIQ